MSFFTPQFAKPWYLKNELRWLPLYVALFFSVSGATLLAQEKLAVESVSINGLTANGSATLELQGKGFNDTLRLCLPFPSQQSLTLVSPTQAKLEVQLGDVEPQMVWGAFCTSDQLASLRRWAIDQLPNVPFTTESPALPISISGSIAGNQTQKVTVHLKAEEYFYVDLQARRLGSNFQPLLRVLDPSGRQVASSGPVLSIDGDAFCVLKVAKAGQYTVTIQDLTYSAPPSPFRLRMASTLQAEQTLSKSAVALSAQAGSEKLAQVWPMIDFRSNAPIGFKLQGALSADASSLERGILSHWNRLDSATVAAEDIANVGKVIRISQLPAIVRGTIKDKKGLRFLVACGGGKPLEADVWATRLASDFDARVRIRALDQRELAQGDDRPGTTDPRARFAGDPGVAEVLVDVESVIPIQGDGESFELVLFQPNVEPLNVELEATEVICRPGSSAVIPVKLNRQGMNQPIELTAYAIGAESGKLLEFSSITVPDSQERALVPVHFTDESIHSQWLTVIARYPTADGFRISQATVPGRNVMATGGGEHAVPLLQTKEPFSASVAWKEGMGESMDFVAGMSYDVPLVWSWPTEAEGHANWKLKGALITTQQLPRTNPQDGNSPLDIKKSLQISASGIAESSIADAGKWKLVVPADAPEGTFQWSVAWTLYDGEGKQQGTAWVTQPKVGRIVAPLQFTLAKEVASPWNWSKTAADNVVQVSVAAQPGIAGKATIQWQGFPQGITVAPQEIEVTAQTQQITVGLPDLSQQVAGTKMEGLKLVIQWKAAEPADGNAFVSAPISLPALIIP
jgi:hypothetical protein